MVMTRPVAASPGCVGSRVYTDVPDDDFCVMIAGKTVEQIAGQLDTIATANRTLSDYHRSRRATLATS